MTATIPTEEPTTLAANTSHQWTRSSSDYPAMDGWTLRYYFRGASAFDLTAAPYPDASGADYLVTIAPADTADLTPGLYRWASYFEQGTARWPDRVGTLDLTTDLVNAATLQPTAEAMVAALEARLAGRVVDGADNEAMSIASRSVQKIPFEKLNYYLGIWRAKLWRQRHPGQSFPQHATRYRAPS